jgi:hypothetical protein
MGGVEMAGSRGVALLDRTEVVEDREPMGQAV